MRLRVLLKELQEWWAIQRCEELETLCTQMLKYSLGDYEDPHRDEIIAKLQADIYLLVDDIVDTITLRSAQYATHNSQSMNLERERLLNGDIFDTERSKALVDLFRNVWLSKRLSVDERNDIIAFVEDSGVELTARQMVVSALMLKCLRAYDKSVVVIFLNLLDEVEAQVRARVMVGLLMVLALHSGRIERDSELSEQVRELFANERFSSDADKAYKHIINTFGTDKVTKKITTEIYPEIFKSGAKLHQMLKEEGGDVMNDDEFNPKWEKALMDDEGVSAKLREFGDMQMQGADVYMSTFSSMKGYAFFGELAHWFMPFDVKQSDVARMMADMPDGP